MVNLLRNMNAKLLLKTIFLIVMLLLLVLIGLNNPGKVPLVLPYLPTRNSRRRSCILRSSPWGCSPARSLTAGGGKRGGASKPAKSEH